MPSRRRILAMGACAGAGAVSSLVIPGLNPLAAAPQKAEANADGTWLTYAVNVEMTWGRLPFLDRLRKVKEAGFSHYEFWPWRNKDIDAVESLNRELGLVPVQFSASPVKGFGHGITNPDAARREEFEEEIRTAVLVAKKLGVKKICVVAGEETKGFSRDEQTQAVIAALKAGARIVEPEGITIILEPLNVLVDHPRQLVVHSEHAASILKAVGSPNVKMLFDIYHQQISEGNLTGNIRKYHDVIGYYQLADHPGRHEPTTGEINYAFVLRTIHETGYRGAIGMEMSPKGDPMAAFKAMREVDAVAKKLSEPA
jgi:hydroxypyruvate isomerase